MRLENAPRVLGPRFPLYDHVRVVMCLVVGRSRRVVTALPPALAKAGITDDVDPASAAGAAAFERLGAEHAAIARGVWRETSGQLHPRGFVASWSLARMHDLLTDEAEADAAEARTGRSRLADEPDVVVPFARGADRYDSPLRPTAMGASFLAEPGGDVERTINEREGLVFLVSQLTGKSQTAYELLEAWRARWKELAGGRMEGRDLAKRTLAPRLAQLVERGLIEREEKQYVARSVC